MRNCITVALSACLPVVGMVLHAQDRIAGWGLAGRPANSVNTVTDALGHSVSNDYDVVGRAIRSTLPDGSSVLNAYDRSESPIATTLPHGETHAFGWTSVGLPASYTAPEAPDAGRRLERTYNAAREQSALVKPDGTVVSNVYDSAGRLSAVVATRGDETERVDFVYDYAGRLDSVTNEYDETWYAYDSFLKIAEVSNGFYADFEYDDDFRVSKKTYTDYRHDEDEQLAEIDICYDDNATSFSEFIRPKMAEGATILLSGCRTADNCGWFSTCQSGFNISKALSLELPGVKVVGSRRFAIGNVLGFSFFGLFNFQICQLGPTRNWSFKRVYVNGEEK